MCKNKKREKERCTEILLLLHLLFYYSTYGHVSKASPANPTIMAYLTKSNHSNRPASLFPPSSLPVPYLTYTHVDVKLKQADFDCHDEHN